MIKAGPAPHRCRSVSADTDPKFVVVPSDEVALLECAFCCGPINPRATVCRHCSRDVTVPLPFMRRIAEITSENENLKTEINELKDKLQNAQLALSLSTHSDGRSRYLGAAILAMLLSFIMLMVAHYLLVIKFDFSTLMLRVASVALPIFSTTIVPNNWRTPLWVQIIFATFLGCVTVFAMSGVVAIVDHVPWLPTTRRDAFEVAEYALSIALAYLAGTLARRALANFFYKRKLKRNQIKNLSKSAEKTLYGAVKIHAMWEALAPLLATGASLWAGLRAVIRMD